MGINKGVDNKFKITDQDKVRGEKQLAQIFSGIFFLVHKKKDFCCSILPDSNRMQFESFCIIHKKQIKSTTARNFSHLN